MTVNKPKVFVAFAHEFQKHLMDQVPALLEVSQKEQHAVHKIIVLAYRIVESDPDNLI